MSKLIIIATAIASIVGLSASLPANAATRSVGITIEHFADRCVDQGGMMLEGNPSFACQTDTVTVECGFVDLNTASCEWAGIDNQIAVNRIIGMADTQALNSGADSMVASGKGGIQHDYPINLK